MKLVNNEIQVVPSTKGEETRVKGQSYVGWIVITVEGMREVFHITLKQSNGKNLSIYRGKKEKRKEKKSKLWSTYQKERPEAPSIL